MAKIRILPDVICNQIAAGEVVDRPAAVLKELLENSIDAGSSTVFAAVAQGGRTEIQVCDNGSGMSPDDVLLAIERHATSKISTIDDLLSIRSLGFRGEALPSIAAVSRFEIQTREANAAAGTSVYLEGGVLKKVREVGCAPGTTITVRDLFFNVPARRKFLRSVDTELSHISDQIVRLSMAYPGIHLRLTHQGRVLYELPAVKERLERIGQVLGPSVVDRLRPFSLERPSMRIHGLMGAPELQRTNTSSILIYVNGRPVWDRLLHRSILGAYENVIPKGKFPVVILFLEMPPQWVDVNVHPTKREVRFQKPREVAEAVSETLRETLGKSWSGKEIASNWFDSPLPNNYTLVGSVSRETQLPLPAPSPPSVFPLQADIQVPFAGREAPAPPPFDSPPTSRLSFSRMFYLGQLANSYLLLEGEDGLIIVDQHAAHERILFDRLSTEAPNAHRQRLARSIVIDLMPREAARLRKVSDWLGRVGFELEPFGHDAFVIHAVPAVLADFPPEAILRDFIGDIQDDARKPESELLSDLAKSSACHGALKANQRLTAEEVRHLLKALDETSASSTCPHGRPLWIRLTLHQLARLFQRA